MSTSLSSSISDQQRHCAGRRAQTNSDSSAPGFSVCLPVKWGRKCTIVAPLALMTSCQKSLEFISTEDCLVSPAINNFLLGNNGQSPSEPTAPVCLKVIPSPRPPPSSHHLVLIPPQPSKPSEHYPSLSFQSGFIHPPLPSLHQLPTLTLPCK